MTICMLCKNQKAGQSPFSQIVFVARRLDGIAINKILQIVHIVELKRSTDMDEGFLELYKFELEAT